MLAVKDDGSRKDGLPVGLRVAATDAELDRLGDFLKDYPEVFGGEMADACEFGGIDQANDILGLICATGIP
jgi:hypothetical protein